VVTCVGISADKERCTEGGAHARFTGEGSDQLWYHLLLLNHNSTSSSCGIKPNYDG